MKRFETETLYGLPAPRPEERIRVVLKTMSYYATEWFSEDQEDDAISFYTNKTYIGDERVTKIYIYRYDAELGFDVETEITD